MDCEILYKHSGLLSKSYSTIIIVLFNELFELFIRKETEPACIIYTFSVLRIDVLHINIYIVKKSKKLKIKKK